MLGKWRELRAQQVDPRAVRQRPQLMRADAGEMRGGGGMSRVHASASRRRPHAAGGDLRLLFEGVGRPVVFSNCPEVLRLLPAVLPTWPREAAYGLRRPAIAVCRTRAGYRIAARDRGRPIVVSGAASALCRLVADLVSAFVSHDRDLVCLHSAAVELGGGLIVFPSTYRAGKSTLVAALAARGVPTHADDVLPIDRAGRGLALGIAPRLRLPLPETVAGALSGLPAKQRGLRDDRYLYLSLPAGLLSPFGRRLPLGAFVVLERNDDADARLLPMSSDEMLSRVISRNFAERPGPAEVVDRLASVVGSSPCFRLTYRELSPASALLQVEFGSGSHVARSEAPRALEPAPAPRRSRGLAGRRFRRRPGTALKSFGGSVFLSDRGSGAIHRLNATGAAVWQLLRHPIGPADAASMIAEVFPEQERRQIRRDVDGLFAALYRARLIALVTESAKA